MLAFAEGLLSGGRIVLLRGLRESRDGSRSAGGTARCDWRSTAAGMFEGERQFRRVKGHRELPMLLAIRCEVNPTEEAATVRAS